MAARFGKSRINSLVQDRFGRYLLYAIGEILLVVIGILTAIQIDQWNSNRKNLAVAEEFVSYIEMDLRKDTTIFGSVIVGIDRYIDLKRSAINSTQLDTFSLPMLDYVISSRYFNIQMNDEAFNRMQDRDVFAVKKYTNLFRELDEYYSFYQDYLGNFNAWEQEIAIKESDFWELQNDFEVTFPPDAPVRQAAPERKATIIRRFESMEGRNYAKMSLVRLQTINGIYKNVYEKARKLLRTIQTVAAADEHPSAPADSLPADTIN